MESEAIFLSSPTIMLYTLSPTHSILITVIPYIFPFLILAIVKKIYYSFIGLLLIILIV